MSEKRDLRSKADVLEVLRRTGVGGAWNGVGGSN
jgi:hypothetical protein